MRRKPTSSAGSPTVATDQSMMPVTSPSSSRSRLPPQVSPWHSTRWASWRGDVRLEPVERRAEHVSPLPRRAEDGHQRSIVAGPPNWSTSGCGSRRCTSRCTRPPSSADLGRRRGHHAPAPELSAVHRGSSRSSSITNHHRPAIVVPGCCSVTSGAGSPPSCTNDCTAASHGGPGGGVVREQPQHHRSVPWLGRARDREAMVGGEEAPAQERGWLDVVDLRPSSVRRRSSSSSATAIPPKSALDAPRATSAATTVRLRMSSIVEP